MTIEEKAKCYDGRYDIEVKTFECLFPELKESEDDRIRKSLLDYLHTLPNHFSHNGSLVADWIAWLEKQAKLVEEYEDKLDRCACESFNCACESFNKGYKAAIEHQKEKQGEQKETLCDKCKKAQPSHSCQDITALGRCYIENINTSTNKNEPKFHEGEWVVWKDKCYKVNYNGCGYELVDQDGLSTSLKYGTIDENAHIWDVTKDAKDGDVLAESKGDVILMFRGIGNARWDDVIDYHFYYDCYRENFIVQEDVNYWGNTENNQLKPATKEQRDLLFQKMRESGYEWDAEEKELKEIEQKVVEWSEEDEETLGWLCIFLNDYGHEFYEGNEENVIDWLKSLKDRVQPKQEWSALDERNLQGVIDEIRANKNNAPDYDLETYDRFLSWLKSLKPQNTWKPSDEQMDALHYVFQHYTPNVTDRLAWDSIKTLELMYQDLKKLTVK